MLWYVMLWYGMAQVYWLHLFRTLTALKTSTLKIKDSLQKVQRMYLKSVVFKPNFRQSYSYIYIYDIGKKECAAKLMKRMKHYNVKITQRTN